MLYKANFNMNLKSIFFVVILFPVIMHIYAENFSILYWNNIGIGAGLLLLSVFVFGFRLQIDREFFTFFFPFLVCLAINATVFSQENLSDFAKYLGYIVIYFFLFKAHFAEEKYYALYIKVITCLFIVMFIIYLLCLFFSIYLYFPVEKMILPANSALLTRGDFTYFMPFYMLVFPTVPHATFSLNGILGLPRFCGYTAEPSAYAVTILPAIYIAWQLKMKRYMYILVFALLITSSYASFAIFAFTLCVIWLLSRKLSKGIIICFLFVIFFLIIAGVSYGVSHYFMNANGSDRLQGYSAMVVLTLHSVSSGFSWLSGNENIILKNTHVLSAYFQVFIRYGFITLLCYFIILALPLKKAYQSRKPIIYGFVLCLLLLLIKASESLSLLLLFFINFLNCKSLYDKGDKVDKSDLYNLSLNA